MSTLHSSNTFGTSSTQAIVVAQTESDSSQTPQTTSVLHLINGEHYSGAERVQDLLAIRLPEFGYHVGFACLKPDRFPQARTCQSSPLYPLKMWTKFDLRAARQVAQIARRENYRVLHAHTPRTALIGALAARMTRLPFVFHVHSPTSRDSTRRLANWMNQRIENWSIRRAAALITVSESLRRHILKTGVDPHSVHVVPNGVPGSDQRPNGPPPTEPWTLGTVALFRPRKGTEVLLEALAQLAKQGIPVQMRAVGPFETPEYEQKLKGLARELGVESIVQWVGFTDNVTAELQQMDLFVLPSLFGEGMPMVVLEAMAAGVPVIATEVEGVPEVIRHGREGLIARPSDAQDLAKQIMAIVQKQVDWISLRDQAYLRHAERFSDLSMAQGVAKVYGTLSRLA